MRGRDFPSIFGSLEESVGKNLNREVVLRCLKKPDF
jgi:hypothetical protein